MEGPEEPFKPLPRNNLAPSHESYRYQPLQDPSHIRLLKFTNQSTASSKRQVDIRLDEYSLQHTPPYKALSYTWGANERPEQISMGNGLYLNVTKNLLAFLVHLCRKEKLLFWIDAICINQDDVQERSSQVRLMKHIYQQAREVVVWLYQPLSMTVAEGTVWNIVQNEPNRQLITLPLSSLKIFHHPWFMRVWVLQEVTFARYITVLFQRDDKKIGYLLWDEVLDLTIDYLDRFKDDNRSTTEEEHVELSIVMMVNMHNWRSKIENNVYPLVLAELLSSTRFCGATESKDKVFALLALASDVDLDTFHIDYNMSWVDISVHLARHTIAQSNTFDILRYIGVAGSTTGPDELPSWVPDFSSQAVLSPLNRYDWPNRPQLSSKNSRDVTLFCNEEILVAKGLKLMDVSIIVPPSMLSDPIEGHQVYRRMLAVLDQWYQSAKIHPSYTYDQRKRINAFSGTLKMTLGRQGVEEHIDRVFNAGLGWRWHFKKLLGEDVDSFNPEDPDKYDDNTREDKLADENDDGLNDSEDEGDNDNDNKRGIFDDFDDVEVFSPDNPHAYTPWAREFIFQDHKHLRGRYFGFASGGQMILLPPGTRKDDHVCLLYGVQTPFILRQDADKYCQVIGACYVHQHLN